MFLSCLAVLTLMNTWVMAEQASRSDTCKLLQQRMGLSVEQHHICLGQGGRELLLAVGETQVSDFPDTCRYWMMNERWNCANISLPGFQKSLQMPNHWVHKCEYNIYNIYNSINLKCPHALGTVSNHCTECKAQSVCK